MTSVDNDLFCHDLPSHPQPEVGKILVTGGTGYIGGRLVPELLARAYRVRVMVRTISDEHKQRWPGAEIVVADALDPDRLRTALEGIHAAYYLITPVPAPIARCLMEGITNEVVCQNDDIQRILTFRPLGYKEAMVRAMSREEQDKVHSRWSDAYPPAHELAMKLHEIERPVRYVSSHSLLTEKKASSLFRSVCRIGGNEAWLHTNCLWRLRGAIDGLLLGVGPLRGRRSLSNLRVGDVIDFWRVEDLKPGAMLLLRAEMKLPGKAWLQFSVDQEGAKNRLSVNAYYQPRGVFGRPYWYLCLPFHFFIFQNLIRQIEERS